MRNNFSKFFGELVKVSKNVSSGAEGCELEKKEKKVLHGPENDVDVRDWGRKQIEQFESGEKGKKKRKKKQTNSKKEKCGKEGVKILSCPRQIETFVGPFQGTSYLGKFRNRCGNNGQCERCKWEKSFEMVDAERFLSITNFMEELVRNRKIRGGGVMFSQDWKKHEVEDNFSCSKLGSYSVINGFYWIDKHEKFGGNGWVRDEMVTCEEDLLRRLSESHLESRSSPDWQRQVELSSWDRSCMSEEEVEKSKMFNVKRAILTDFGKDELRWLGDDLFEKEILLEEIRLEERWLGVEEDVGSEVDEEDGNFWRSMDLKAEVSSRGGVVVACDWAGEGEGGIDGAGRETEDEDLFAEETLREESRLEGNWRASVQAAREERGNGRRLRKRAAEATKEERLREEVQLAAGARKKRWQRRKRIFFPAVANHGRRVSLYRVTMGKYPEDRSASVVFQGRSEKERRESQVEDRRLERKKERKKAKVKKQAEKRASAEAKARATADALWAQEERGVKASKERAAEAAKAIKARAAVAAKARAASAVRKLAAVGVREWAAGAARARATLAAERWSLAVHKERASTEAGERAIAAAETGEALDADRRAAKASKRRVAAAAETRAAENGMAKTTTDYKERVAAAARAVSKAAAAAKAGQVAEKGAAVQTAELHKVGAAKARAVGTGRPRKSSRLPLERRRGGRLSRPARARWRDGDGRAGEAESWLVPAGGWEGACTDAREGIG